MSNLLVSEQKMQNFKLKQGKLCSNSLKAKGLSIYLDIGVFPSHSFIIFGWPVTADIEVTYYSHIECDHALKNNKTNLDFKLYQ